MVKVKHERTADCVVAGFRTHKDGEGVGSLLLGLFDDDGHAAPRRRRHLVHGSTSAGSWSTRSRRCGRTPSTATRGASGPRPRPTHGGRMPGGVSRWNAKKDLSWEPLRPELVAEVGYEHVLAGRFRQPARLVRWRPDREPASCTYDQLEVVAPAELASIFTGG